jgi:two-component sensor histidine kinase
MKKELIKKDLFIKEMRHRLKNHMQIILSLLNLQAEAAHPEDKKLFNDAYMKIRTVTLMQEQLAYGDSRGRIELGSYLKCLIEELVSIYEDENKNIQLDFSLKKILLCNEKAILCGLIINELATNTLKYAFNDQSDCMIKLKLDITDNLITITYEDNGSGVIEKKQRREGGLGLELLESLTEQLSGVMLINQQTTKQFKLSFIKQGRN